MLFSAKGRRIAGPEFRVFGGANSDFYRLIQPENNYKLILDRIQKSNLVDNDINHVDFERNMTILKNNIKNDKNYKSLLHGVHIPFAYRLLNEEEDLGVELEQYLLPSIQGSYTDLYPNSYFKAILQGNSELKRKISLDNNSRYEKFVKMSSENTVVGWYFPQALQEFDVASQRTQMRELPQPNDFEVCLSGAKDTIAAYVGSPTLLTNTEFYSPVLCMSSYVHTDPRMILLLKLYGPHLEFWCMSQMLTKDVTQVSEQWTGGISIYQSVLR